MWGSFVEYAYLVAITQKKDHFLRYGIRIFSLTRGLYFFSSDHKQPYQHLHWRTHKIEAYMELQLFLVQYCESGVPKKIALEAGKHMEGLYLCPIRILWNNVLQSNQFSFYSLEIEPQTIGVVWKWHLDPGSWKFFFVVNSLPWLI